jgi:hypothetical protein
MKQGPAMELSSDSRPHTDSHALTHKRNEADFPVWGIDRGTSWCHLDFTSISFRSQDITSIPVLMSL